MGSTDTLAERVNGLVGRYTLLSAERTEQARCYKAEASYLYGAAAAFEVVATELWEALGRRGAVPRVAARTPPAGSRWPRPAGALRPADDFLRPLDRAESAVFDPLDGSGTT